MTDRKTLYVAKVAILGALAGGILGVIWHFPPIATVALAILGAIYTTAIYCFCEP